ncbi:MAG: ABC transporter ATP-binding protein, partial [Lachnospiraceae bacterium]|nr:ABC transporter ATP-binding protein [Lachnospiraceae bacterium]
MGRGRNVGPKPKLEDPVGILKRVFGFIFADYKLHLIVVLVGIVGSVLCSVRGMMFTKTLVDDYITPMVGVKNPDFGPLRRAMAVMAVIYLTGVICTFAQNKVMIYVTQGTLKKIRLGLFSKMEKLPVKYFDTHSHGDIMSVYTNDVDSLRQMISMAMPQFINSAVTIASVLVSMIILSIPLTVVTLIMVAVTLAIAGKAASKSGEFFVLQQRNLGAVNGHIEEMIGGQKVVKVFCHEKESIETFDRLNEELFESAKNANQYVNILGPLSMQLSNVSYVLCALASGALALTGFSGFTLGGLASFLSLNRSFTMPINQITQQFNSIVMALAGAERIFKLMDEEPEVNNGYVTLVNAEYADGQLKETDKKTNLWAWKHFHKETDTTTYVELKGDVVFDDVDFGYDDEKTVLHNIKMYARPGQKIAFVGSTGAGKTTITNLINRFYDIQDGKIRYDGININKIRKEDLRHSLGMVLQDTHLFTGTVRENIRYGRLDATDEEVVAAAKLANAHGFISRLPEGYDTMLSSDGASLSQGQRQLLSIARAAVANPPVLILDEATSSIDTRTEKLVQAGMDRLMNGRTTFVIAHRLATIKNSDCIMVMEQG